MTEDPRRHERPAGSVRAHASQGLPDVGIAALVTELERRVRAETDWQDLARARLLGSLGAEIDLRNVTPANHYSVAKSMGYVQWIAQHPDVQADLAELQHATCVDVGCGSINPVGPLFGLLLAGAGRGIAIDVDEVTSLGCATRALYACLAAAVTGTAKPPLDASAAELLARVESFDLDKLAHGDASGIDRRRLDYVQKPLAEAGLDDGSADVFLSMAFFEHVPDPDAIIAEMARASRPGALGLHSIDGADHRMYSDASVHPLAFLREPGDDTMLFGSNRIRPLAFAELFERHGFEVRRVEPMRPIELGDDEVAAFAPQFRGLPREHLEVTGATFYVRRR